MSTELFEVGALVRHSGRPDWGIGQVQSNAPTPTGGVAVTVTFEHAGKQVFLGDCEALELVAPERGR